MTTEPPSKPPSTPPDASGEEDNDVDEFCDDYGFEDFGSFTLAKFGPLGSRQRSVLEPGEPVPYRPLPQVRPYCLGFRRKLPEQSRQYVAQPQVLFRISGLLIWGATRETFLTECRVGSVRQLMAGDAPMPALFFEAGLSLAELAALAVDPDGKATLPLLDRLGGEAEAFETWLSKAPRVKPHQLFQLDTLSPGQPFTLTLWGHFDLIVAWGVGVR